ncbi:hypothetical protein EON65_21995 [archaeon]|nr:MAG: hypothetical protein EON65_21995 [archaeon]
MAQKINMMSFWSVFYVTLVYWFVSFVLQIVFPASGIMAWMMCLFSLIFSICLRLKIYARDNIQTPGGCFTECCIGFWCCPCSIAQSKCVALCAL